MFEFKIGDRVIFTGGTARSGTWVGAWGTRLQNKTVGTVVGVSGADSYDVDYQDGLGFRGGKGSSPASHLAKAPAPFKVGDKVRFIGGDEFTFSPWSTRREARTVGTVESVRGNNILVNYADGLGRYSFFGPGRGESCADQLELVPSSDKFKVGDRVILSTHENQEEWVQSLHRDKVVGTIRERRTRRSDGQLRYRVSWTTGVSTSSPEEHLSPAFKVGDKITGDAGMPHYPGEVVTGTIRDLEKHEKHDGTPWLSVDKDGLHFGQRYIVTSTAKHVIDTNQEETPMNVESTPALIGPKPVPAPEPRFVPPFRRSGDYVKDSNDKTLIESDQGRTLSEDRDIAQVVVDALNEKYDGTEVVTTVERTAPLRILARREGDEPTGKILHTLAFEVRPGRFLWGNSLAELKRDYPSSVRDGGAGWTLSVSEAASLFDLNTGEHPTR